MRCGDGGGVEFMRAFWDAATFLDPGAVDLTERRRFPFCTRDGLIDLAGQAGLHSVTATAVAAPTKFTDLSDLWHPFTLGTGPAPGYCANLDTDRREQLKEKLRSSLHFASDGSLQMNVRAWAEQGRK